MEFKEFRRRIKILQEAMVKRGISEDQSYERWCNYIDPAVSNVFQKTIGCGNDAMSWRTDDDLWVRKLNEYNEWAWEFVSYSELTDEDIKEFCRIHDIMELVPPEVYGEPNVKLVIATEVEFMDI